MLFSSVFCKKIGFSQNGPYPSIFLITYSEPPPSCCPRTPTRVFEGRGKIALISKASGSRHKASTHQGRGINCAGSDLGGNKEPSQTLSLETRDNLKNAHNLHCASHCANQHPTITHLCPFSLGACSGAVSISWSIYTWAQASGHHK